MILLTKQEKAAQEEQTNGDGRIGDVETGKRAYGDKVDDVAEPEPVDEIPQGPTHDQPDPNLKHAMGGQLPPEGKKECRQDNDGQNRDEPLLTLQHAKGNAGVPDILKAEKGSKQVLPVLGSGRPEPAGHERLGCLVGHHREDHQ